MALVSGPVTKHKLTGIGEASASAVLALLSTNPQTSFLAIGISGKIIFWGLSKVFTLAASGGLVMMNIGAEKLLIAIEKTDYDGSREKADKLIEEIRKTGRDLTPEEIKRIDAEVIKSFRKFGRFVRNR